MNEQGAFAVTGLTSRGGWSNWVFFFFSNELVMIDLGMTPSIKAGFYAGVASQLGGATPAHGPIPDGNQGLSAWCTELRAKAKNTVALQLDQVRAIRLLMKITQHQLFVTGADGIEKKFVLMNRNQAAPMIKPLEQGFGSRFQLSKTPVYQFLERRAPFLVT